MKICRENLKTSSKIKKWNPNFENFEKIYLKTKSGPKFLKKLFKFSCKRKNISSRCSFPLSCLPQFHSKSI